MTEKTLPTAPEDQERIEEAPVDDEYRDLRVAFWALMDDAHQRLTDPPSTSEDPTP